MCGQDTYHKTQTMIANVNRAVTCHKQDAIIDDESNAAAKNVFLRSDMNYVLPLHLLHLIYLMQL